MKIYSKQEWYTPGEVAVHNKPTDCWISYNGKVYDLTSWLQDQLRLCHCTKTCSCKTKNWFCDDDCVEYCQCFKQGFLYCDAKRLAMTIIAYAGKDVSHWFKESEWVQHTHPIISSSTTYQPHAHGNRQPVVPSTRWRPVQQPWWMNEGAVMGKVTARTRPIRITNTVTSSTVTLEVCSEESLYQVMLRYLPHNSHTMSYTWRYLGKPLCYNRTLAQNGIPDDRDLFSDVALPENIHIPAILIYYDDDLTEDPPRDDCFCSVPICFDEIPEKVYRNLPDFMKHSKLDMVEVAVHNRPSDCWVSLNGKVYNLSPWLKEQFRVCHCTKNCSCVVKTWLCDDSCVEYCPCFKRGYLYCDGKRLAMTMLAYAGKDVSHWFKGSEWVRYTHPTVGSKCTYQQHGHGNRQPVVPSTRWRPMQQPWWMNEDAVLGKATAKTRPIRITNTLTGSTVTLEVCSEESLYQVMMRYLPHNSHMMSYTWRYLGKPLCYNRTLLQNGIPDERDRFSDVALPENIHIPAILIYYDDDLTEDPPRHDCFCQDPNCLLYNPEKCYHD